MMAVYSFENKSKQSISAMSIPQKNSVRNLANLYTVMIGVALTNAIGQLIDPTTGLEGFSPTSLLLFIAFLFTLIPFYHGALRHLDNTFIERNSKNIKKGALIIDIGLLLTHALFFVMLALLINKPGHFAWVLVGLLAVDCVWGIFTHFGSSVESGVSAEWRWAAINGVFISLAVVYLVIHDIYLKPLDAPLKTAIPLAALCFTRTMVDYIWCSQYYFPSSKQ